MSCNIQGHRHKTFTSYEGFKDMHMVIKNIYNIYILYIYKYNCLITLN